MKNSNINRIVTNQFSNPLSETLYKSVWANEPEIAANFYYNSKQCGGCSFFAKFDSDWGLCCHSESRHHLETVFEHFTCPAYVEDGWEAHRFVTESHREVIKKFDRQNISIVDLVSTYISTHNLGIVTDSKTPYILNKDLLSYSPDLGFIAKGRAVELRDKSYHLAPDLAIKIVTSFDTAEALHDEIMMYLQVGTRLVWVVYPRYFLTESILVYRLTTDLDFQVSLLMTKDTLDGGDVLPGFSVPVKTVFQRSK